MWYATVAGEDFLLEAPDTAKVPGTWVKMSQNKSKKVVRYRPPLVASLLEKLELAREERVRG